MLSIGGLVCLAVGERFAQGGHLVGTGHGLDGLIEASLHVLTTSMYLYRVSYVAWGIAAEPLACHIWFPI